MRFLGWISSGTFFFCPSTMGSSSSKARDPIVPPDVAAGRFDPDSLDKLQAAFTRVCSPPRGAEPVMRQQAFERILLSNIVETPRDVAMRLWGAWDTDDDGLIRWDEFVSAMAVLCHGTDEERARMLFYFADKFRSGSVSRADLVAAFKVFNHKFVCTQGWLTKNHLNILFPDGNASDPIPEQIFVEWALDPRNKHLIVVRWLHELAGVLMLAPPDEDAYRAADPLTQRQNLVNTTHFTLREIEWLEKKFMGLQQGRGASTSRSAGRIDGAAFHLLLASALPETLREMMFRSLVSAASKAAGGMEGNDISSHDLIRALSICSRGSFNEQIAFCFGMFDDDGDGVLSRSEVDRMLAAVTEFRHLQKKARRVSSPMSIRRPSSGTLRSLSSSPPLDSAGILAEFGGSSPRSSATATNSTSTATSTPSPIPSSLPSSSAATAAPTPASLTRNGFAAWARCNPLMLHLMESVRQVNNLDLGVRPLQEGQEREVISKSLRAMPFKRSRLALGQTWYVLSEPWFRAWAEYVDFQGPREGSGGGARKAGGKRATLSRQLSRTEPGPIDNHSLTRQGSNRALRPDLYPGTHFRLVNGRVWSALVGWYGGGPELPRCVIEDEKKLEIELYPIAVRINQVDRRGHAVSYARGGSRAAERELLLSRITSVADLKKKACKVFGMNPRQTRIWDCPDGDQRAQRLLEGQEASISSKIWIEDINLADGQLLLLEQRSSVGGWPRGPADDGVFLPAGSVASSSPSSSPSNSRRALRTSSKVPGVSGLQNLGNTCYMNSSLQCLGNVRPLIEYFRSNAYITDLNTEAAMGSKMAELADSYGSLIETAWGRKASRGAIAPRHFKKVLGRFKETFSGYNQEDAQEFLSAIFDGLGEDLNRIKSKPYIAQPDSEGRPDAIVADEWWVNQKKRENSIIQAIFTGQFKSKVRCRACSFESARFEPFTFLQLPLPDPTQCTVQLIVHYYANARPLLHCSVRVPIRGCVADVLTVLCETQPGTGADDPRFPSLPRLSVRDLALAIVLNGNVRQWVDSRVKSIRFSGRIIHCYQVRPVDIDIPIPPALPLRGDAGGSIASGGAATAAAAAAAAAEGGGDDDGSAGSSPAIFGLQSRVQARFGNDRVNWWPGRIVSMSESNPDVFGVQYDDGDYNAAVARENIRPLHDCAKPILLTLVHRRYESGARYFWNSLRPAIFGHPIILRLVPAYTTGYELYKTVWEHTRYLIPGGSGGAIPPPSLDARGDVPPAGRQSQSRFINLGDGFPHLAWGFVLRRVNELGVSCPYTEWTRGCFGTELTDGTDKIHLLSGRRIAIDWDPSLLSRLCDPIKTMQRHRTVDRCHRIDTKPLSLYECVDKFTTAERLEGNDQVYCSKCKAHQDATKRVTLFRNPPVLVVHLKRFKFTQYSRGKIASLVTFPIENADLRFAMPPPPAEKIGVDLSMWTFLGGKLDPAGAAAGTDGNDDAGRSPSEVAPSPAAARNRPSDEQKGEAAPKAADLPPPLYDCIGVVNHFGDLGAGHYTAFAKNPFDKKWRYFDDSRVEEVADSSKIVTKNAYLLFYVRQDLSEESLAPDFEYRYPTPAQLDKQLALRKKLRNGTRCVIQ